MATIPTPSTQTASAVVTSTLLNNHRDGLQYLLGSTMTGGGGRRPVAQMRQTVAQSIAVSGTWTAVTFDAEDVDYDAGHSTVTNTDRYTAATTGWHWVNGGVSFAANATGNRGVRFTVNGTVVNGSQVFEPAGGAIVSVPCRGMLVFLNATDILRLEAFQTSTAALNTSVTTGEQPSLAVEWRST